MASIDGNCTNGNRDGGSPDVSHPDSPASSPGKMSIGTGGKIGFLYCEGPIVSNPFAPKGTGEISMK